MSGNLSAPRTRRRVPPKMTSTGHDARCTALTLAGVPCRARARKGGKLCLSHDPASAAQLAASRKLGGLRRRRRPAPPRDSIRLRTIEDAFEMLESAGLDVERLDHSANRVRLKIAIAETAARMVESSDLLARLEALEAAAAKES